MRAVFCIGVLGCGKAEREFIKNTIHKLSFLRDMEIGTYWFDSNVSQEQLEPYLSKLQIALISVQNNRAEALGEYIYRENPNCLICFCGEQREPVQLPLHTRPISYHPWEKENISDFSQGMSAALDLKIDSSLMKKLSFMIDDSKRINKIFCAESKRMQIAMPVCSILFFQSDLKYIILHCKNGETHRFFGKLSDVCEILAREGAMDLFISTHKSYLVNRMYITAVDKTAKTVRLFNGDDLPISTAQYNHVLERLGKL